MTSQTIEELLSEMKLEKYGKDFKDYGVEAVEDILHLTPEDWNQLKTILPFHRTKIIHQAAFKIQRSTKDILQTVKGTNDLHTYTFSSNGPYNAQHKPENLNNFDPEGYGLTSSVDSFMKFTFSQPMNVYGVIIGNNIQVSGGWGAAYLEGVQVQVKVSGSEQFRTVHTINGVPNTINTAYLAKIQQNDVREVRLWKNAYFSTSYIHFV